MTDGETKENRQRRIIPFTDAADESVNLSGYYLRDIDENVMWFLLPPSRWIQFGGRRRRNKLMMKAHRRKHRQDHRVEHALTQAITGSIQ